MGIHLQEHKSLLLRAGTVDAQTPEVFSEESFRRLRKMVSKRFNDSAFCYRLHHSETAITLSAEYCIGLDWLGDTGRYIYVEPKVNTKAFEHYQKALAAEKEEDFKRLDKEAKEAPDTLRELNYLEMLLDVMAVPEAAQKVSELVQIDFNAPPVPIPDNQDHLTPFLVVQFLQLLRRIVQKGLRKSYYKVTENLTNRVKGKILVGQHLRQNVFKNRFTQTLCEYQVFGTDTPENRFLKKALRFAAGYVENHQSFFGENLSKVQHLIYYTRPAFELVGEAVEARELRQVKPNPLFREYGEAIRIGGYLLRRFGYNISNAASGKMVTVPPFWIDMPGLFERYVYAKLLAANPETKGAIHFQFPTHGNVLDFLISDKENPMVIDAKYKMCYESGTVIHTDIRQVAGYARLTKVLDKVAKSNPAFDRDKVLPCLIIHPETSENEPPLQIADLIHKDGELKAYYKVYSLGVPIPFQKLTKTG